MAEAETCECRTNAIGRCAHCDTPVCMHHSRLLDGRTVCVAHHTAALKERAARAPDAAATASPPDAAPKRGRRPWGRRS